MASALVEIVVHAVKEKYKSEKAFYQDELGISAQSWDRWKKGEQGLKYENIQIISTLFTDYEWMLVQKVTRNFEMMSGLTNSAVNEYNYIKFQIARTWINNGIARIEWKQTDTNALTSGRRSNYVVLRLIVDYNLWGYSDVLEVRLPGVIQQEIGHDQVKLLQWVDDESDKLKNTDD